MRNSAKYPDEILNVKKIEIIPWSFKQRKQSFADGINWVTSDFLAVTLELRGQQNIVRVLRKKWMSYKDFTFQKGILKHVRAPGICMRCLGFFLNKLPNERIQLTMM